MNVSIRAVNFHPRMKRPPVMAKSALLSTNARTHKAVKGLEMDREKLQITL
jgi:hypothetical protein